MSQLIRILALILLFVCAVPLLAQDDHAGYQEALRRMEEARRTVATELMLFGEIPVPPEIGQLSQLKTLHLYNVLLPLPPEIWQLKNLENLIIGYNELWSLPPEIGQLTSLKKLLVTNTALTILPPEIGDLSNLEWLEIRRSRLQYLPREIGQLDKLEWLVVPGNQLTYLPGELGNLERLNEIDGLILDDNPLHFPPAEVIDQGTPAVLAYLRAYEVQQSEKRQREVWVGIAGVAAAFAPVTITLWLTLREGRGYRKKKKRDAAWNQPDSIKIPQDILDQRQLPAATKQFLRDVGLPLYLGASEVEPLTIFREADFLEPFKFHKKRYYILGDDEFDGVTCVRETTGEVVVIAEMDDIPVRFLNSSLQKMVLFSEWWRELNRPQKDKKQLAERRVAFQAVRRKMQQEDPPALADEETCWSIVLEDAGMQLEE